MEKYNYEHRHNCINLCYENKNGDVIDKLFYDKESLENFINDNDSIRIIDEYKIPKVVVKSKSK